MTDQAEELRMRNQTEVLGWLLEHERDHLVTVTRIADAPAKEAFTVLSCDCGSNIRTRAAVNLCGRV